MKTWLQVHGLRKHDPALPGQKYIPTKSEYPQRNSSLPSRTLMGTASEIPSSKNASRMSIERYLQAPLEDEPASVPAINAALKEKGPPTWTNQTFLGGHRRGHSRGTSNDANSDGRRTFYTSASGQESTGTSFSIGPRSSHHQRSNTHDTMPDVPNLHTAALKDTKIHAQKESASEKTLTSERTLGEFHSPNSGMSVDSAFRARIEAELILIQQKARMLEAQMRRIDEQKEHAVLRPSITNEMAYKQMASNPKLAWILGDERVDFGSAGRPTTSASVTAPKFESVPSRPDVNSRMTEEVQDKSPRRSKSSSVLGQESRRPPSDNKRAVGVLGQTTSKRPKFFCTFCQKRFHGRAEWIGHEKNIHMPEELWVCCPRIGESLEQCPFCAQNNPSSSHLDDHNYFTCLKKSLSERTFDRKDHFLQHIAQEHNVSAGQKPLRLTQLAEAWRRPLPLKEGHQALHCGFCGQRFSTYAERTDHVTGHFMKGIDMMSWWSERISHPVMPPEKTAQGNPALPFRCCYCNRTFASLDAALETHPTCRMWSCSFLPGMQYTIYPSGTKTDLQAVCCYCNDSMSRGDGKVKGTMLREHVSTHNFRNCNQRLYFSAQQFRQHLQDNHKCNYDGTLFAGWTLLLKSSRQERTAVFEAVDVGGLRRALTDPVLTAPEQRNKKAEEVPEPKMNFMDFSETPQSVPRRRIRRKASTQTMPDAAHKSMGASSLDLGRAVTLDLTKEVGASAPDAAGLGRHEDCHISCPTVLSHAASAAGPCIRFLRRRIDGSMRNRLYTHDDREGPLTKNSQKLFRKIPASTFGSLVLHSSLLAATPARLTNSVDIYTLH